MGEILIDQADRTDKETLKAYIGSAHLMGVYSTIREHDNENRKPDIDFDHGKRHGFREPVKKLASLLEKRKME